MTETAEVRKVVGYLRSLQDFVPVKEIDGPYHHMGATICDAVLQAGVTYETVVRPRIRRMLDTCPKAAKTSDFLRLIQTRRLKEVILWKNNEKPRRIRELTMFLVREGIETEVDLADWLADDANYTRLLMLRGIGPKTADYLKILVGIPTAAPDRYVFRLLEDAGMPACSYGEARDMLNAAADEMGVDRALLDHSIWQYMSRKPRVRRTCQRRD